MSRMVTLKVRTKGLQQFISKTENVIKALDEGVLTDALLKKVIRRAKYCAPRKKGYLVKGIRGQKTGKHSFKIICDVTNKRGEPYPAFLEYGTRFIKIGTPESPRVIKSSSGKTAFLPYMSWASWRTLQEVPKIFKDKILKFYT